MNKDERVAGFYTRVMRRVCDEFAQQHNPPVEHSGDEGDADALAGHRQEALLLIEQKWRERLAYYTGHSYGSTPSATSEEDPALMDDGQRSATNLIPSTTLREARASTLDHGHGEDDGDVAELVESARDSEENRDRLGNPHNMVLQSNIPSSIYASMMKGKRKIEQLDGTLDSDDSDAVADESDEQVGSPLLIEPFEESANAARSPSSIHRPPASSVSSASSPAFCPVDVAPVTNLSVSQFAFQCSARDVSFALKKNAFQGKWKNAIVTLLRKVHPNEQVTPRQLLWLVRSDVLERSGQQGQQGHGGMVVEVVTVEKEDTTIDTLLVVQVAGGSRQTLRVRLSETRRFYECIVAECQARFQFSQIGG